MEVGTSVVVVLKLQLMHLNLRLKTLSGLVVIGLHLIRLHPVIPTISEESEYD